MKRAFTLVEVLVVLVIILILAAILFPLFARPQEPSRKAVCQSNLKQIGLGFAQYVQDYNGKFPPARVTALIGWADVLQPYVKSTQIFQCPFAQNHTSPLTDYFYNSRAAGMVMGVFSASAQTILTGDGDDDGPTWASLSQMPASWKTDKNSPAWRHVHVAASYGCADGHVKALKPSEISNVSPKTATATFAVR